MARKKNKSNKAPSVSGFSKNVNQSKNAFEKEQIKREVQSYNDSNDLLERQMELEGQKNKEEMKIAEKKIALATEEMTAKLNDAVGKMNVLAENVKSSQQSNENLEMKVMKQSKDHQDELKLIKTRQEEDLLLLKTKLGSLEAENKELVERNELMAENQKKSELKIKEFESEIYRFSIPKKT